MKLAKLFPHPFKRTHTHTPKLDGEPKSVCDDETSLDEVLWDVEPCR